MRTGTSLDMRGFMNNAARIDARQQNQLARKQVKQQAKAATAAMYGNYGAAAMHSAKAAQLGGARAVTGGINRAPYYSNGAGAAVYAGAAMVGAVAGAAVAGAGAMYAPPPQPMAAVGQQMFVQAMSAPAQQQLVQIVCPQGVVPGQMIQVQTYKGPVNVQVPAGVYPGTPFQMYV